MSAPAGAFPATAADGDPGPGVDAGSGTAWATAADPDGLRIRWLGRVRYAEALTVQRALWARARGNWLLLLEHPAVVTLGVRADPAHLLVDPASVGAERVEVDRGGDVTWHGPGQLVGYPVLDVAALQGRTGGAPVDTRAYVAGVEDVVLRAVAALGIRGAGRRDGYPGVWLGLDGDRPRKIAAVGVRLARGRSMHGFALNVDCDLTAFDAIVPCGLAGTAVTSLAAEGCPATLRDAADAVAAAAAEVWGTTPRGARPVERQDVAWRAAADPGRRDPSEHRVPPPTGRLGMRLGDAGVTGGLAIETRKPAWLRAPVRLGDGFRRVERLVRDQNLATVCEEAGCPNRFECWADGTATFLVNGERCTRACGFCQVDTAAPLPLDPGEPARVAEAVATLGLRFAVLTAPARDDLPDGGAAAFAACVEAIHDAVPGCAVEVLIPDFGGDPAALDTVLAAGPAVLNHNLETVARLQRAVRPQAGYARSLGVLARAAEAGFVAKSGLVLGLGEGDDEVLGALADLAGVGVSVVTLGQYLRPSAQHAPVARWVPPATFEALAAAGRSLGLAHVEASPLTRSSYHARQAAGAAGLPVAGDAAGAPVPAPGTAPPARR